MLWPIQKNILGQIELDARKHWQLAWSQKK
jgi:hypothetical protein